MTVRVGDRRPIAVAAVALALVTRPAPGGEGKLAGGRTPTVQDEVAGGRWGAGEGAGTRLLRQLRSQRADLQPPLVRVLLTAPQPVVLPQPGRRYAVATDKGVEVVRGPLVARAEGRERPAFQVGAFGSRPNAQGEAERLQRAGFDADVRFGQGAIFRVVVLARPGESEESLRARLAVVGVGTAVRAEGTGATLVVSGEGGVEVRGRQLQLVPFDPDPVRLGDRSFRGELVLAPSARGVQVVNVLNLEEYLRGVVPAEMGPRAFSELEALKAQAVAARTYVVRHLGSGGPLRYDICDTQACQVYGGASVEHPLSDEAVRATAGLIATYGGGAIDAMYHSTCGGHTAAAAEQFPARAAPYLVGVPCRGERSVTVGAAIPPGPWLDVVGRLAEVGKRAAAVAGVTPEAGALATALSGVPSSGAKRELLAAAFALEQASALLGGALRSRDDWLDSLLALARAELPPAGSTGRREEEALALVVRLAQLAGVVREIPGRISAEGEFVAEDGTRHFLSSAEVSTLARRGAAWRRGEMATLPGASATLWLYGVQPLAVEVEERWEADVASTWSWWTREFTAAEVARACGVRQVERIEPLKPSPSGRITALALHGAEVRQEMRGIEFRYALGLPDNRFVVLRQRRGNEWVFRFLGRGWGHGVGMCQHGAVGLARGGASFAEILFTYYPGVQITRWQGEGIQGGR